MNKLFTKIAALALGATMAVGVGVAVASNSKAAEPVRATDATVTFTAGTDTSSSSTITKSGITIGMSTLSRDDNYRANSGTDLTVSSSVGNITKVDFTCTGSGTANYGPSKMGVKSGSSGSYSYSGKVGTWTGNVNSFIMRTTAQVRMTEIEVTYTESGKTTIEKTITGPSNMSKEVNDLDVNIANDIKVDGSVFAGCTVTSSNENVVSVSGTTLSFIGGGSSTITISHEDVETETTITTYESASFTVTVSKSALPDMPNGNYKKITSSSELADGYYLLVADSVNKAFNGSLASLDQNAGTAVTISSGRITANNTLNSASLYIKELSGSTYSIAANVTASGNDYKYIGRETDSNGIDTSDSPLNNTISIGDGGLASIVGTGGRKLNWYSSNSNFRYYGSGNTTLVYLYKKLSSYTVTKNATYCTIGGETSLDGTSAATYTITPNANYLVPNSITVTRGGSILSPGTHYTYSVSNNIGTLTIPAAQITGNFTIAATAVATYLVSGSITNGSLTVPGRISSGGALDVTIVPTSGHGYPVSSSDISVTNATLSSYDDAHGVVTLSNPTGDVTVTATCPALGQTFTITTTVTNGSYSGDETITDNGGVASVTISPTGDYKLPTSVTVTGADHTYNSTSGVISLSNATDDVTISAAMVALTEYTITVNQTNGTHTGASTIKESRSASLTFVPDSGYGQPADVTVSGATYTWTRSSGALELSNPSGNVTVTYVATENELTEITLSSYSGSYTLGDPFDDSMVVTAHYSITADQNITNSPNLTVSGYDPYTEGTHTVTFSYTEGGITKSKTYEATVSAESVTTITTWTLVTDSSTLAVGDEVVIASSAHNFAISTTQNTNNRAQTAITKDGSNITWTGNEVQILTLTSTSGIDSAPSGSFGLYTGAGYLYAASDSSNHLKTQVNNNVNGAWVISISDGTTSVAATASSNRNVMRYNQSNNPPMFACYTSEKSTDFTELAVYKKYTQEIGTKSLIRIVGQYSGAQKNVGDTVLVSDFTVKAQYNTGETLYTLESGVSITEGAVLNSTSNPVTLSYTEGGITKTTVVIVAATQKSELEHIKLVVGENAKLDDYIAYSGAAWDLTDISVKYEHSNSGDDYYTPLADLMESGASISPVAPTAGATSFTVSYSFLEKSLENNVVTLDEAVVADYVQSVDWKNKSLSHFKAFSGGQLTATTVSGWTVKATYAGAGESGPLSFGTGANQFTIRIGDDKAVTSLPYTWTSADDGKFIYVVVGGVAKGDSTYAKANICATINAIDHEETVIQPVEDSATWTVQQSIDDYNAHGEGTLCDTGVDIDSYIHMQGNKGSSNTSIRFWSDGLRCYNGNKITFTPSNGAVITKITFAHSGCSFASGVTDSTSSPYIINDGYGDSAIEISLSSSSRVDIKTSIIVEYVINEEVTSTVHYANQMEYFDAQKTVVEFAKFMNDTMNGTNVCTGTHENLESAWKDVADKYDELFGENTDLNETQLAWAKKMLEYATAQWGSDAEPACVEKAMKTYDYCVGKYSLDPFMDGVRSVGRIGNIDPITIIGAKSDVNVVAIVVITSVVSLTAIGGYFFLRKRKENI